MSLNRALLGLYKVRPASQTVSSKVVIWWSWFKTSPLIFIIKGRFKCPPKKMEKAKLVTDALIIFNLIIIVSALIVKAVSSKNCNTSLVKAISKEFRSIKEIL